MNLYVENAVSSYLASEILFGVHFGVHYLICKRPYKSSFCKVFYCIFVAC